jgi:aliphatic sulfonates family ABC transporter substrate-binding protein
MVSVIEDVVATLPILTLPNSETLPLTVRAKALVFEDPASRALLARIAQVAPSDATVLITGETGTGKEIVARHVHALSARAARPFVAINCGAFPESLVEAELFGHERGSFTGATQAKEGWFEAARGGTLFLDEIGDLPPRVQVKLLRVLQEREVVRLGARVATPVDVRLVAATNVDLADAVSAGRFREDLFYRLAVANLTLAPLRERPGDIAQLARHFLEVYRQKLRIDPVALAPEALERLLAHPWPGNIRELENVVHHALLVCRDRCITVADLRLSAPAPKPAARTTEEERDSGGLAAVERALAALYDKNIPGLHEKIEEVLFRSAYEYCHRNQMQTARLLDVTRNVLRARLIQIGELRGRAPPVNGIAAIAAGSAGGRVRIGFQKFGLLALLKARRSFDDALAARGLSADWREVPAGYQLVEAMKAGSLDLGVVGEAAPIFAQAADAPIVYLAAEPPAPDAEAIVVHRDSAIRAVGDLKGKTVAVARGANADYLLIRALEEAHVRYEDVHVAWVPPSGARAAFDNREVDAWAIWDPLLAAVSHGSGARVLRDGTGLARNVAFYVGTRSFVDQHPELVELFLGEVRRLGRWANQHPDEVAALLATELGLPRAVLELSLRGRHFGAQPIDDDVLAGQQTVADTLHRMRLIARPVTVAAAAAHWGPPRAALPAQVAP